MNEHVSKEGPEPVSKGIRVAIIGAGPAGFYAAEALTKQSDSARVDLFERLPSPYGLVRYGVAPDHETVKAKARAYDLILRHERVRYFGNVTFGRDFSRDEVKAYYDAVIYTIGASSDRDLNIPGEDLLGSYSATEFIAWYNAHPDHADLNPPLDAEHVAVVGMGNVALDVTRALLKDPDELAKTDMASYAVDALKHSKVTDVHILGRRGPSQANFTPKELREVDELPGVSILVDQAAIAADRVSSFDDLSEERKAARNLELFTEYAKRSEVKTGKRVHIHFFVSPVEVLGAGRVQELRLEKNHLEFKGNRLSAVGTRDFEYLDVGLLLRSVGYRSEPLPGVPFDEKRGVIRNKGGRVVDERGEVIAGEYTSGWVRRGPSGVIGTNKVDAEEVVGYLLEDAAYQRLAAPRGDISTLLESRGLKYVTAGDWLRIRNAELRQGEWQAKASVKFSTVHDMLSVLTPKHNPLGNCKL